MADHPLDVDSLFSLRKLTTEQEARATAVLAAARALVLVLDSAVPPSEDRSAAIRKVREAVWTAVHAISRDERVLGTAGGYPTSYLGVSLPLPPAK